MGLVATAVHEASDRSIVKQRQSLTHHTLFVANCLEMVLYQTQARYVKFVARAKKCIKKTGDCFEKVNPPEIW